MASIIRKIVTSPLAPAPIGPYSQSVIVGNTMYISGQIGMDVNGKLADGIEEQTRVALQNVGHILKAAGGSFDNVVKCTVLLSDMSTFQIMNNVYAEFFKSKFPARAAYQVAALPKNALVEIESIAIVGKIEDAKL